MSGANPALLIEKLYFSFSNESGSFALKIASLKIDKGERVALIGPSGSGKSTLLGLICGILTPGEGSIIIFGNRLENMSARERDNFRANMLGVIFQQFNLLPYLSVLDNVILALEFSNQRQLEISEKRERAVKLLKALGLAGTDILQQKATQLSVGQQQRVAAARAFIGRPPLIVADEPTSALDEGRQTEFLDLLFAQQKQTQSTLLMVTHDDRVSDRFDRVLDLLDICDFSPTEPAPS